MNCFLSMPFTALEVKDAISQIGTTKSPWPDRFPALFYQNNWNVVGDEVTRAVLNYLNEGGTISDINHTFIVLIPKVKNPECMNHFRPISLCNVIYQIISKY